jgi:hypothetical protein
MHRRKVHHETWMLGKPWADFFAMVRTDVVTHEMNRADLLGNLPVQQRVHQGDGAHPLLTRLEHRAGAWILERLPGPIEQTDDNLQVIRHPLVQSPSAQLRLLPQGLQRGMGLGPCRGQLPHALLKENRRLR